MNTSVLSSADLKAIRQSLGYSQSEFARQLSRANGRIIPYSKGYIANMERGVKSAPITPQIASAVRLLQRSRPGKASKVKPPRLALTIDYTDDAQRQRHLTLSMDERRAALDAWLERKERNRNNEM